jgi:hypothetical protein
VRVVRLRSYALEGAFLALRRYGCGLDGARLADFYVRFYRADNATSSKD